MRTAKPITSALAVPVAFLVCWGQAEPTARVGGRVCDLFGRPLVGAEIEVSSGQKPRSRKVSSDEHGDYQITGMEAGTVSMSVGLRGFEEEKRTLYVGPGDQVVLDIGLEVGKLVDVPTWQIAGTLRSLNHELLGDATVTVVSCFNDRLRRQARTDQLGRYKITVDNAGQYLVYAAKPGYMVAANALLVPGKGAELHEVNLILQPLHLDTTSGR